MRGLNRVRIMSITLSAHRIHFLFLLTLVGIAVLFFHSIVFLPFKLFVVLLHETGHAVAALVSGGRVVEIVVHEGVGGHCVTEGGSAFLIASSGYLGSLVFGGILLWFSLPAGSVRRVGAALGVIVLILTVAFVRNLFGVGFGLLFGSAVLINALKAPLWIARTSMQFLGAVSCLYALIDLRDDLFTLHSQPTDASILAGLTGIPALVWSVLWGGLSLVLFLVIMKTVYRHSTTPAPLSAPPPSTTT